MTTHAASKDEAQTVEVITCPLCRGTGHMPEEGDPESWRPLSEVLAEIEHWPLLEQLAELGLLRRRYTHARSLGGTQARELIYQKTRELQPRLNAEGIDQDTAARAYGLSRAQFWNIMNFRAGERPVDEAAVAQKMAGIRALLQPEDIEFLRKHGLRGL